MLLLFQRGLSPTPVETAGGVVPAHDAGGPGHLAFAVDASGLPAWESRLAELGIAIESRVQWERGGFSLYFRDPDNRSVELATPGVWQTYQRRDTKEKRHENAKARNAWITGEPDERPRRLEGAKLE